VAKTGRIHAWVLDKSDKSVLIDSVQVDRRGRLTIPSRLWNQFPGINETGSGDVLLEARVLGCVVVRPWKPAGEEAFAQGEQLRDSPEERRALYEVYRQGRIETRGRLMLPHGLLGHLHVSFTVAGVYLARFPERIEIYSRAYRAKLMREAPDFE
jgi:DNA-binding transcriptional regulator/RsmH inhibitor MraZ